MREIKPEVQELISQGKALYSVDNYDEAIRRLEQAVKLDPYCEDAYENLGVCYVMADRYDQAKAVFNRFLLLNKKSATAYFHLGNIALLENDPEAARAMFSQAELLGYASPVLAMNLASYYEEVGDVEGALGQYSKVLRSSPYAYDVLQKKADLLIRAERYEEALSAGKKMVQTDIDRFEGHHYVYVALIMLGRNREAGQYIDQVIERFPDEPSVQFDRIRLLDLTGKPQEALDALDAQYENWELRPHVALLKLGLLLQLKRPGDAIRLVEDSPTLQKDPDVLTLMFSLYYGQGSYQKALEYCQMILEHPADEPVVQAADYFLALTEKKLGNTQRAGELFDKAIEKYRRIYREDPRRVDLAMYRTLCEYQLGRLDDAVKGIEFLLALQPGEAAIHLTAAEIYSARGDREAARQHRDRARELDPSIQPPPV